MTFEDTTVDEVKELLKIKSVRAKTSPVFELALKNELNYFDVNLDNIGKVLKYVVNVIQRDFGTEYSKIPPHGRWNHLNAGGELRIEELISKWEESGIDSIEIGRKLIDLIVFSVLIDAGAGNDWKYKEIGTGKEFNRSEGLAIVSIDLFKSGSLSEDEADPYKVSGSKLIDFTKEELVKAFQITEKNKLTGEEGRLNLLRNLGKSLVDNEIFGKDNRPGNMIDYLFNKFGKEIDLAELWNVLMDGFSSIWPKGRTTIKGISLGDAWYLKYIKNKFSLTKDIDTIIPFHKLTQWLTYSLLQPLSDYGYKFKILNADLLTGLPEYRNGGLFYDFEVIKLKPEFYAQGIELSEDKIIPAFKPDDGVIVEWRSITIGFLDYLLPLVNNEIGYKLALPQLIEAGSWKSGREIAAELRPQTKGPPIDLYSDGTVF